MKRWRARAYLVILAAVIIAGGAVAPFIPEHIARDVLAAGMVIGGLAMLTVALIGLNGHDQD